MPSPRAGQRAFVKQVVRVRMYTASTWIGADHLSCETVHLNAFLVCMGRGMVAHWGDAVSFFSRAGFQLARAPS